MEVLYIDFFACNWLDCRNIYVFAFIQCEKQMSTWISLLLKWYTHCCVNREETISSQLNITSKERAQKLLLIDIDYQFHWLMRLVYFPYEAQLAIQDLGKCLYVLWSEDHIFYFINFLSFYLVLKNKQKVELLMLSARLFTSKFTM